MGSSRLPRCLQPVETGPGVYLRCTSSSGSATRKWTKCTGVSPLLSQNQSRHPTSSLLGKRGQAMGVGIQGDADVGVSQAFTYHLGMDSGRESEGGVGMPEIMEPDSG